jgi:hypothetical protein
MPIKEDIFKINYFLENLLLFCCISSFVCETLGQVLPESLNTTLSQAKDIQLMCNISLCLYFVNQKSMGAATLF